MPDLIAFDAELATPIILPQDHPDPDLPGIAYATGFDDFDNMRIAVLCALEIRGSRPPQVFQEDNLKDFSRLIRPSVTLISFNGYGFDAPLLQRRYGIHIPARFHYDLLAEWKRVTGKRVSLDHLAKANDLPGKNGEGVRAPWDWNAGQCGRVINYCFNDCFLLARLMEMVIRSGVLRDLSGRAVSLPSPERTIG